jgi:hypothetical protein
MVDPVYHDQLGGEVEENANNISNTGSTSGDLGAQPVSTSKYNFSLLGKGNTAQLALNGEVVSVNFLKMKGFTVEPSPIKEGEHCFRCAPRGGEARRKWWKASIPCNGVRGEIWICQNCSTVYERKKGGNGRALWAELTKDC